MGCIVKPALCLICLFVTSVTACTSTQNASGEIYLSAEKPQNFRLSGDDFQIIFSHYENSVSTKEDVAHLFSLRLINNTLKNSLVIGFDNDDCDQFISYSVSINRGTGTTHEYFDNQITLGSSIDIQMTKGDDGNQILLINGRRIPLNIKLNYRKLVIDSEADYKLFFNGLVQHNLKKEK